MGVSFGLEVPVIVLYRRHKLKCPYAARSERRCKCPIYAEGSVGHAKVKQSLNLTSWEAAQKQVREWEAAGTFKAKPDIATADALDKFIADCEARALNEATLRKYRWLKKQLLEFAAGRGLNQVAALEDAATLRDFRASWQLGHRTAAKQLERLKAFLRFCQENQWIEVNAARLLKAPKVDLKPTLPFNEDEQAKIRAAAFKVALGEGRVPPDPRLPIFIDILLETGLRIGDAAVLRTDRINDGKLFLYSAKSGTPVWMPLKPELLESLETVKPKAGYYFINSDSTNPISVAEYWRQKIQKVFKEAKIGGHPHQFRDTFSVNLLKAGVPIGTISILLGHSSVAITEKHYAPWVKERQEMLTEALQKLWEKPKLVRVK
jgi:integrase/recombinase XerD